MDKATLDTMCNADDETCSAHRMLAGKMSIVSLKLYSELAYSS